MTAAVASPRPVEADLLVRRMNASDLDRVAELFRTAGDDDLHNRFFTLGDRVVNAHLAELEAPAHPRCLVAVSGDRVVGIVELATVRPGTEEIALLVASDLHQHGIGTALMRAALTDACDRGVQTIVAEVLATNHLMLEVFTATGATFTHDGGEVVVSLPVPRVQRRT